LIGLYGPLSLTPQRQRTRTLQALVNQLVELSRRKAVLFVLEDAHWIDATTLELVDLCLDYVASARVMMLVTTRPTFQHGFGGHPIVTKLALNRLGRDQIASIVNGLAQAAVEPSATSSAEMRNALDDYRRTGARFQVPFLLSLLAEASLERKNWNEGMATISEALALIEETGEGHVAECQSRRGMCCSAPLNRANCPAISDWPVDWKYDETSISPPVAIP
jgi:hypothetical protein